MVRSTSTPTTKRSWHRAHALGGRQQLLIVDAPAPALLGEIAGPAVVEPTQLALQQALDRAFTENAKPPYRNTKAVVVVRDGKVIADERP